MQVTHSPSPDAPYAVSGDARFDLLPRSKRCLQSILWSAGLRAASNNDWFDVDFTPTQAAKVSRETILTTPNFGRKTLNDIERWLQSFGLGLES